MYLCCCFPRFLQYVLFGGGRIRHFPRLDQTGQVSRWWAYIIIRGMFIIFKSGESGLVNVSAVFDIDRFTQLTGSFTGDIM